MIETVGKIEEPKVDEEIEIVEPEGIMVGPEKESPKEDKKLPPATIAPAEEVSVPKEEREVPKEVELEKNISIAPEMETIEPEEEESSEEFAPIEEKRDELPPADDAVAPLDLGEDDEEIAPLSLEKKDEGVDLVPLDLGEDDEEESSETAEAEITAEEDRIAPQENLEDDEDEEDEDIFLTPGERKIKAEYGQVGIDVYNLIDGQRTAEEIMKSTGITETKLIEMLDFMEKKGIIKLEHPGTKRASTKLPSSPKPKEVGFAPKAVHQDSILKMALMTSGDCLFRRKKAKT